MNGRTFPTHGAGSFPKSGGADRQTPVLVGKVRAAARSARRSSAH